MSSGWISVMGLYYANETIFDDMVIPAGVDRDSVKDSILWETAELEVLLTNPDKFKWALSAWSKKRMSTWDRVWKVMQMQYDPLENYRRNEERTINRESQSSSEGSETGTIQDNGSVSKNDSVESASSSHEEYKPDNTETIAKTGYDSGSLQTTDQVHRTGEDVTDLSVSNETLTTGETTSTNNQESNIQRSGQESGSDNTEERVLAFGNIGTLTSQQMLMSEIEVAQVNMIEIIVEEFKEAFCLLVY